MQLASPLPNTTILLDNKYICSDALAISYIHDSQQRVKSRFKKKEIAHWSLAIGITVLTQQNRRSTSGLMGIWVRRLLCRHIPSQQQHCTQCRWKRPMLAIETRPICTQWQFSALIKSLTPSSKHFKSKVRFEKKIWHHFSAFEAFGPWLFKCVDWCFKPQLGVDSQFANLPQSGCVGCYLVTQRDRGLRTCQTVSKFGVEHGGKIVSIFHWLVTWGRDASWVFACFCFHTYTDLGSLI